MIYKNPLNISANELQELKGNLVAVQYKNFELEGYIGYIILCSNNPSKYETFEFTLTSKCKSKLKNDLKLIPKYFTTSNIKGIAKLNQKASSRLILKVLFLNL